MTINKVRAEFQPNAEETLPCLLFQNIGRRYRADLNQNE
jgi:hypothetical protein